MLSNAFYSSRAPRSKNAERKGSFVPFPLSSPNTDNLRAPFIPFNFRKGNFLPHKGDKINNRPGGKMLRTNACSRKDRATRLEKIQNWGIFFTEEPDCCSLSQEYIILCPLLYHVYKNKQRSQGNLPPPFFHVELISKPYYL